MGLPPTQQKNAEALLTAFCEKHSPKEHLHHYRVTFVIRNPYITLYENRPSIRNKKKWTSIPIARIRFDPGDLTWELYWLDQNEKGHSYDGLAPTVNFERVLKEIERNVNGVFFG